MLPDLFANHVQKNANIREVISNQKLVFILANDLVFLCVLATAILIVRKSILFVKLKCANDF